MSPIFQVRATRKQYGEVKKDLSAPLTDLSIEGLHEIAISHRISCSELLEKIARGQIDLALPKPDITKENFPRNGEKKAFHTSLTATGLEGLSRIARGLNISRSELLYRIGSGYIKLMPDLE